jgi:alanine transaminase
LLGGTQIGYYLDESNGWSLSLKDLQSSVDSAKAKGITPKALVIINPGNPTGQALNVENMKEVTF